MSGVVESDGRNARLTIWHLIGAGYLLVALVSSLSIFTGERLLHYFVALVVAVVEISIAPTRGATFRTFDEVDAGVTRLVLRPSVSTRMAVGTALFVLWFGSALPDADWLLLSHRNPIMHSVLPFLGMRWLCEHSTFGNREWARALLVPFGYGLGSHLLLDVLQPANVVAIPTLLEAPFLGANGIYALLCARRLQEMLIAPIQVPV